MISQIEKVPVFSKSHKPSYFVMEAFIESSRKYKELIEEPVIYHPSTSADVFKYIGKDVKAL